MTKRRLGRTNLEVSVISLGTVEIGMDYGIRTGDAPLAPDYDSAEQLLNSTLDLGVNFIDTARAYGDAESIIGRAIGHRRGEYYLCSKVMTFPNETLSLEERRKRMFDSVEQSLRLLRTDTLDVLMLHSAPVEVIHQSHSAEILAELRSQGKIRFTGASVYGEQAALAAIECGAFDCLQIAQSVLDRRPESKTIPAAAKHDVGLVARSVLLKGALTHRVDFLPDALAPIKEAVAQMRTVAESETGSLPELAYRYLLSFDSPQSLLVGTAHLSELQAALEFERKGALSPALIGRIREAEMLGEFYLNPGNWPN